MNKEAPILLTEWDWFKIYLQMYALQRRAALFSFSFEFERDDYVVCSMHGSSITEVLKETTNKEELLGSYFSGWIGSVKREVANVLRRLPVLGEGFSLDGNLVFEIMWDYGSGV